MLCFRTTAAYSVVETIIAQRSIVRRTSLTDDCSLTTRLPELAFLVHLGILGDLASDLTNNTLTKPRDTCPVCSPSASCQSACR